MHHNLPLDTAAHRPEAHRHLDAPARGTEAVVGQPCPASGCPGKDAR